MSHHHCIYCGKTGTDSEAKSSGEVNHYHAKCLREVAECLREVAEAFRPSTDQALAGGSVVVDAATGDRDESKGEIKTTVENPWSATLQFEDDEIFTVWGSNPREAIANLNLKLMEDAAAEMRQKGAA